MFVRWPIQRAPHKEFIMTTINTSSLGAYSSVFTAAVKTDDATKSDVKAASVELRGNVYGDSKASAATESGDAPSMKEEMIKQLQEQIERTQKILQQQQAQLAAAQGSKAPDELKATQVMAIQQQISGTMAQLGALQASLLNLMKVKVDTTA
jgi:Tfp pilus assembly protein FimV